MGRIKVFSSPLLVLYFKTSVTFWHFLMSVNSTLNITRFDRLAIDYGTLTMMENQLNGSLKFQDIYGHTTQYLAVTIVELIDNFGIHIKNCVRQTYDNVSNKA